MNFNIIDETSNLRSVIIGIAKNSGNVPKMKDFYDPQSLQNFKNDNYPSELDLVDQLGNFVKVLRNNNIKVYRPKNIKNCNQIFVRDVGFVIDNIFFKSNILPKRKKEFDGIKKILNEFDGDVVEIPQNIHVEGGDIISFSDNIFIGYYSKKNYAQLFTARTNKNAVEFFKKFFPKKKIKEFHLNKSNKNPNKNALHLDCCLQIVGERNAIVCPDLFTNKSDVIWLKSFFGEENILFIDQFEMSSMYCNVLSLNKNTLVSQPSFTRLNKWLLKMNFNIEKVDFREVSKQGGSFRCCSLPLIRK